jgi:hypothetical protein
MNYLDAQNELSEAIKMVSSKVKSYFWRLSGDAPNSLCRFLGMEEKELKSVLRLCKILNGEKDNFSKNQFELLMSQCGCDYTTYRLQAKVERFILIGNGEGELVLPKDQYDLSGALQYYPVEDEHFWNMRTKSQRGSLTKLLAAVNVHQSSEECKDNSLKEDSKGNRQKKLDQSPKALLFALLEELVSEAGSSGDGRLSARSSRKFQRLFIACVDTAAKELIHVALEKLGSLQESVVGEEKEQSLIFSPERISSTVGLVSPAGTIATVNVPIEVADANEDEDDDQSMDTTNEFIAELKEEVVLQSLLHKRIHEKKERVFQLEHRNGRRLLVVLPPDTMSVSSFEEEAKKTDWVNIMLNTDE